MNKSSIRKPQNVNKNFTLIELLVDYFYSI